MRPERDSVMQQRSPAKHQGTLRIRDQGGDCNRENNEGLPPPTSLKPTAAQTSEHTSLSMKCDAQTLHSEISKLEMEEYDKRGLEDLLRWLIG